MEGTFPGLTRPVLFSYRFYNQDLTTGSLLIEVGGHGNNLNEALYAGQLAAAAAIAKTGAVWSYLPVLIPAAILAGTLTGLCTQLVLHRLAKAGVLPEETSPKKQEEEANG